MPCPTNGTTVLCEPAQSKCTWTGRKSNFMREIMEKMPRPSTTHERGQPFCGSLRGRNAHGHSKRTLLCENLQEKNRDQRAFPDLTPALTPTSTVRTTQCGHTVWGISSPKILRAGFQHWIFNFTVCKCVGQVPQSNTLRSFSLGPQRWLQGEVWLPLKGPLALRFQMEQPGKGVRPVILFKILF